MSIGIYKITNPEGKIYIGQSINIEKRWKGYKNFHCKGQHKLYNSLKKYGPENHIFEIIEECIMEELDIREEFYKKTHLIYNTWDNSLFLQIKDGKGGLKSDETKNKISKANKGKPKPEGFGAEHSKKMKGKKYTEEHKIKISEAHKGKKHSLETKQKQSNSHIGKKLGPQTSQHRENISASVKNKIKHSFLSKNKISKANKGKPKPEGFGAEHSKKMKGKKIKRDKKIYSFLNKSGLIYSGTRYDFAIQYNILPQNVNALINNKRKKTHGWSIIY